MVCACPQASAQEISGQTGISDSGWSVAAPSVIGASPYDPRAQIMAEQLLRRTRVPLLRTPASPLASDTQSPKEVEWRKPQTAVSSSEGGGQQQGETTWVPLGPPSAVLRQPAVALESSPPDAAGPAGSKLSLRIPSDAPRVADEVAAEAASVAETEAEEEEEAEADEPLAAGGSADRPEQLRAGIQEATGPAIPDIPFGTQLDVAEVPPVDHTPGLDDPSGQSLGEPEVIQSPSISSAEASGPQTTPSDPSLERDSLEAGQDETPPEEAVPAETTRVPAVVLPQKPPRPLTRDQQRLRARLRQVLTSYYRRPLNSRDHDPWEMMHGMLAYGVYSRVLEEGPRGRPVTSVGWLCYNMPCKGQTLLQVDRDGQLRAKWGVGLQGHYGQFLAMLAQSRVQSNYPIRVDGRQFTVEDLVRAEQATCYSDDELTFKLLSLMYYLDSDAVWVNDKGETWDISRLIREELAQPIRGAACGGTHRLSGLSLAVKTRLARGEPLDGEYARADQYIRQYHNYAFSLQNPDGSLSTEWFRGRGNDDDLDRRVKTTGHILEWLLYSLDDEQLSDRRTMRAVNYLTNLMYSNYSYDWEIGPMSHAIHALVLYDQRVYQPHEKTESAGGSEATPQTARAGIFP